MSTVTPKLLYSVEKAGDIPVWEIRTEKGNFIYFERVHVPGYRPIGLVGNFKLGSVTVSVCEVVTSPHGKTPTVLKEKDGYVASMSWYEKDPTYTGKAPAVQSRTGPLVQQFPDQASDSDSDSDYDVVYSDSDVEYDTY
jgi:hypothetical protein